MRTSLDDKDQLQQLLDVLTPFSEENKSMPVGQPFDLGSIETICHPSLWTEGWYRTSIWSGKPEPAKDIQSNLKSSCHSDFHWNAMRELYCKIEQQLPLELIQKLCIHIQDQWNDVSRSKFAQPHFDSLQTVYDAPVHSISAAYPISTTFYPNSAPEDSYRILGPFSPSGAREAFRQANAHQEWSPKPGHAILWNERKHIHRGPHAYSAKVWRRALEKIDGAENLFNPHNPSTIRRAFISAALVFDQERLAEFINSKRAEIALTMS